MKIEEPLLSPSEIVTTVYDSQVRDQRREEVLFKVRRCRSRSHALIVRQPLRGISHGLAALRVDFERVTPISPKPTVRIADRGRMTGSPEVISSPVGLVPINALVFIDSCRFARVPFRFR
jgi:hypothetical protein